MKINWKIRFKNLNFVFRFIVALIIPALTSLDIEWQSLTTWEAFGDAMWQIISNPVVLALIGCNALNMLPDGTTYGWSDSTRALTYKTPNEPHKTK